MKLREQKGITLIALVITIVVLLILAAVSFQAIIGDDGLLNKASNSKTETRGGTVEDRVVIWKANMKQNKWLGTGAQTEEELLQALKNEELVFEEEIDRENKIIKIGNRIIEYGREIEEMIFSIYVQNDAEADKRNVVLPILDSEIDFSYAFSECSNIVSIPEGLFDNCLEAEEFQGTFEDCIGITNVPEELFNNCPEITSLSQCFSGCIGLTQEIYPLWTIGTNNAENSYRGNPNGEGCFYNCINLTNYSEIPSYWVRLPK